MSSVPLSAEMSGKRLRLEAGDFVVEVAIDTRHLEKQYGPRFDRSAVVVNVRKTGIEFVEPRGLCDEFGLRGLGVLGYADAAVGEGEFLKIGVGVLRRDDAGDYNFVRHWPIAVSLPVEVVAGERELAVTQRSPLRHGYGYRLTKRYEITTDGVLTITYELENTGAKPFAFEHYNHNFFSFGGKASDEHYTVRPGFKLTEPGNKEWLWRDGVLRLGTAAPARGGAYIGVEIDHPPIEENRLTLTHRDGAGVEIAGDFPLSRFAVWAIASAICPELFFRAEVSPNAKVRWSHIYKFRAPTTSTP